MSNISESRIASLNQTNEQKLIKFMDTFKIKPSKALLSELSKIAPNISNEINKAKERKRKIRKGIHPDQQSLI